MKKGHGRDGDNEDSKSESLVGSSFHTNVILAPHGCWIPQGSLEFRSQPKIALRFQSIQAAAPGFTPRPCMLLLEPAQIGCHRRLRAVRTLVVALSGCSIHLKLNTVCLRGAKKTEERRGVGRFGGMPWWGSALLAFCLAQ